MAARLGKWPRRLATALGLLFVTIAILLGLLRTPDISVANLRAKYGSPASQYLALVPGSPIHLRDEGPRTGFPVVLLHGSNASLHTWEPWVKTLTAKGYRVITLDFPGHGLSGPVPSRDYSAASYVDVLEKAVAHLGLRRFALGGNSMGGGVSWLYAHRHPDQIAGLILVDSSGQPAPKGQDLPLGFRIARMPGIRSLGEIITPRAMMERSLKQSVSVQESATPAVVDRYWELLRYPGNRRATIDRFTGYAGTPRETADAPLAMPAAVIWGAEDRLIPVSSAVWFAQRLPNSRVTVLGKVGHIPMEEAPERSLVPVLTLLEQVSAVEKPTISAAEKSN
ncbi:alpha/beta hydrolase [Sandarakinorhabdus sp.]|uniref:alpha/beta fold hydrolase n=1 Tax=Sandarakinorhabdus sp. TaxID=1916663 RepID=UPI00286E725A|nr:alpha/beta hydrolase [Sandarakinorhabdus sp.]